MGTALDGEYGDNLTYDSNYLQSPVVDLSAASGSLVLYFQMWLTTEGGNNFYDRAQVQVSTDGATWSALPMMTPAYHVGIPPSEWSGEFGGWMQAIAVLDDLAGQSNVAFRWALSSDRPQGRAGFYVDDVIVGQY
jgi:hypothetical protein